MLHYIMETHQPRVTSAYETRNEHERTMRLGREKRKETGVSEFGYTAIEILIYFDCLF